MKYEPKLNDYVSWRNVEGWVYYVDENHLTIEIKLHCSIWTGVVDVYRISLLGEVNRR